MDQPATKNQIPNSSVYSHVVVTIEIRRDSLVSSLFDCESNIKIYTLTIKKKRSQAVSSDFDSDNHITINNGI
jgi:hypothetical protein